MQRVVVKYGAWGTSGSEGSARMVGRVLPSVSKWSFRFDDSDPMTCFDDGKASSRKEKMRGR
jgi:hypothetical protein